MELNEGVRIEFLGHSGFLIVTSGGKRIAIDPYNVSENVSNVDLILITHSHYDHCSIKDIQQLAKDGTTLVVPADSQSKVAKIENINMEIIEIGDELEFGNTKVEAVPAYNVDKEFHPKREGWMGFLLRLNGVSIYHAGDTDKIPEMSKLTGHGKHGNQFVALLPVSGKFVMDSDEASEVANMLSPDLCIPMHYGAGVAGTFQDAEKFVELCTGMGLKAKVLDRYDGKA